MITLVKSIISAVRSNSSEMAEQRASKSEHSTRSDETAGRLKFLDEMRATVKRRNMMASSSGIEKIEFHREALDVAELRDEISKLSIRFFARRFVVIK